MFDLCWFNGSENVPLTMLKSSTYALSPGKGSDTLQCVCLSINILF
jgi:hypothetical protein